MEGPGGVSGGSFTISTIYCRIHFCSYTRAANVTNLHLGGSLA